MCFFVDSMAFHWKYLYNEFNYNFTRDFVKHFDTYYQGVYDENFSGHLFLICYAQKSGLTVISPDILPSCEDLLLITSATSSYLTS